MLAGILHTASSSSSWVRCKALTPNGVLHHRKNKVGSLRRTQSELEIKLARYHGEDPATVQQDDMALPENLNMKVMCVSRSLLYPHPVLWMRSQSVAKLAVSLGIGALLSQVRYQRQGPARNRPALG
eukprot:725348-Rhodomonas_salina.3